MLSTLFRLIMPAFIFMNVYATEVVSPLDIEGFNSEWSHYLSSQNIDQTKIGDEAYRPVEFATISSWGESQYPRMRQFIPGVDDREPKWVPYQDNRIQLANGTEMSASYITFNWSVGDAFDSFIASHAPTENNVHLFWKMIWEKEIEQIVMVTEITDDSVNQLCYPYLPGAPGEMVKIDSIEILCTDEKWLLRDHNENIQIRTFQVCYEGQERTIKHYWYHNWPDKTAPLQTDTMAALIQEVAKDKVALQSHTPILAHCAAGVGRTGTFIACYHLYNKAVTGAAIPQLFDVIALMRWQRPNMVSKLHQYQCCYQYYEGLRDR